MIITAFDLQRRALSTDLSYRPDLVERSDTLGLEQKHVALVAFKHVVVVRAPQRQFRRLAALAEYSDEHAGVGAGASCAARHRHHLVFCQFTVQLLR